MKQGEYNYCLVAVYNSNMLAFFKTDDESIVENTYVKVPYGDTISVGIVVRILTDNSCNIKKAQSIITKITKEEYDKATDPVESKDEEIAEIDELKTLIKEKEYGLIFDWADCHRDTNSSVIMSEVVKSYKICMKQNMALAAERLGKLYNNGNGVEQDYSKAYEYFETALAGGSLSAMVELGIIDYYGKIDEPNYEKAYARLSQAAMLSQDPVALYLIGDMYLYGQYVKQDQNFAFIFYDRAASGSNLDDPEDENVPDILKRLGKCYAFGLGVPLDYEYAHLILTRALNGYYRRKDAPEARNNIKEVKEMLSKVESELDSQIVSEKSLYEFKN